MAAESRRIIKRHWKVNWQGSQKGDRVNASAVSQSLNLGLERTLEIPGSKSSPRWEPYFSILGTTKTVSQKGCSMSLTVYSFLLGVLLTKQGIPADHQIATVLGNRQSQRGKPSTASGSHLHWVTPMEIPVKTFQPFLPEASPWDSASCRSKGGTGSNHTARAESQSISNWKVPIRTTESNSLLLHRTT